MQQRMLSAPHALLSASHAVRGTEGAHLTAPGGSLMRRSPAQLQHRSFALTATSAHRLSFLHFVDVGEKLSKHGFRHIIIHFFKYKLVRYGLYVDEMLVAIEG